MLGLVAQGEDPAADKKAKRASVTVSELCDAYLADAKAGRLLTRMKRAKAASTLLTDRGRIDGHIRPLLGSLPVAAVTSQDVERFMHAVAEGQTRRRVKSGRKRGVTDVRGGMGTASRTVGLLGAIFTYAVRRRIRVDNPVRGVMRPADGHRERRLSEAEYGALGKALRQATDDGIWPAALAMARFLALTGWRSGEALALRWADVDLGRRTAVLPTTKTGKSVRPAGIPCRNVGGRVRVANAGQPWGSLPCDCGKFNLAGASEAMFDPDQSRPISDIVQFCRVLHRIGRSFLLPV